MPLAHTEYATVDALEEGATVITGLGIITLTLFPLALPAIALTAALALPLLAVGLAAGLLAAPIVLVRRLIRRERTSL